MKKIKISKHVKKADQSIFQYNGIDFSIILGRARDQ